MIRPAVAAAVVVCRVVLGEVSADMADALAAAEAWAGGEAPTSEEYISLYDVLSKDARGEAAYWVLSAAYEAADVDESAYCLMQALATLATLPGWDNDSVRALHASLSQRDTIPTPAPEFDEAA